MFPITEFTKCLQGTMTSANLRIGSDTNYGSFYDLSIEKTNISAP